MPWHIAYLLAYLVPTSGGLWSGETCLSIANMISTYDDAVQPKHCLFAELFGQAVVISTGEASSSDVLLLRPGCRNSGLSRIIHDPLFGLNVSATGFRPLVPHSTDCEMF